MSYPYCENWRDLIRPETVVVFDHDQISFLGASSNESRSIKAVHKESGRAKEFKNVTEFWGGKKFAIEGWLGDENLKREVKGLKPFTKEDFTIETIQAPQPIAFCLSNIKAKIESNLNHLGLTNYIGILGGELNFRLDIDLPHQYKSNRDDMLRPLQLSEARDYVRDHKNGKVINNFEADDALSMYQAAAYKHYKKRGWFNYLVASFDKDQFGSNGLVFNNFCDKGSFKHPTPMLIEGLGNLFLDKGKVKGTSVKFMCHQLLIGDSSDAIAPYQDFGIKFGEKASYKLLEPCKTIPEALGVVVDQYKEWFPDGVKFTSFKGNNIDISSMEWLETIFQLVYMKRSMNDKTTFKSFCAEHGLIL